MKTFTVEGFNWAEDYQIDPTLFDNYEDMAFEAMTQALEEYMGFSRLSHNGGHTA